jgi:hypothetical protein
VRVDLVGPVVEWRGPAPYHYVRLPPEACEQVREVAAEVSYGWGVVPVRAVVGDVDFRTSLFPREGGYLLPLKDAVRRACGAEVGDEVAVELHVGR